MYHFYATLLLTIVLLILAILSWRSDLRSTTRATAHPYFFLLAYAIIAILAIIVPTPVSIAYKAAILFGILLALLGTIVRRALKAPPVVVHAIDLLVALLYVVTFLAHHPLQWPTPWLLLPLLLVGALYLFLRPHLAELHSTVLVYGVVLWLMLWQAMEVLTATPALWTGLAVAGALGFVLVKAVLVTAYLLRQPPAPHRLARERAPTPQNSRWTRWMRAVERVAQRWGHHLRIGPAAQTLALAAPLLILFYQWLLVISIWGPSLTERIGQLP